MLDFGAIIVTTAVEDLVPPCRIFTSHSLDYFLQHSGLYAAEVGGPRLACSEDGFYAAEDGGAKGLATSDDGLRAAFQLQVG
jgi:hypothetical protein